MSEIAIRTSTDSDDVDIADARCVDMDPTFIGRRHRAANIDIDIAARGVCVDGKI